MAASISRQKQKIQNELDQRKRRSLIRQRNVISAMDGIYVQVGSKWLVNFSSNDYLLLSQHPKVKSTAKKALDEFAIGGNGSALVTGYSHYHEKLENQFAEYTGYAQCITLTSGYQASMAVLTTLAVNVSIYLDKRVHASLLDAARASTPYWKRYPHNDIDTLKKHLEKNNEEVWIVTDGVFSMDGDTASLKELVDLKQNYPCKIYLDDAHGFGVIGKKGKGTLEHAAVDPDEVDIYMTTFGKALGTNGAVICTSTEIAEAIIQLARPYVYTTALSPVIAAATSASLDCMREDNERRMRLKNNIDQFNKIAVEKGVVTTNSVSAIQSIIIGNVDKTLLIAEKLKQSGFLVAAIREPTVPPGTSRLRISLCSEHSVDQIETLLEMIACHLMTES